MPTKILRRGTHIYEQHRVIPSLCHSQPPAFALCCRVAAPLLAPLHILVPSPRLDICRVNPRCSRLRVNIAGSLFA